MVRTGLHVQDKSGLSSLFGLFGLSRVLGGTKLTR